MVEKRTCPGCEGFHKVSEKRIEELEKTKAYEIRHGNVAYEEIRFEWGGRAFPSPPEPHAHGTA